MMSSAPSPGMTATHILQPSRQTPASSSTICPSGWTVATPIWRVGGGKGEEAHGLHIEGGDSSEPAVVTHGSMAVFSHRRTTRLQFDGHSETRRERETLAFGKDKSGRWLALHRHLSLDPSHEPT